MIAMLRICSGCKGETPRIRVSGGRGSPPAPAEGAVRGGGVNPQTANVLIFQGILVQKSAEIRRISTWTGW